MQAMGEIPGGEVDIIQLNIAKTRTIQEYHIIGALNPIFLATIRFDGKIA
jgi:precorrin-6B methylase 2